MPASLHLPSRVGSKVHRRLNFVVKSDEFPSRMFCAFNMRLSFLRQFVRKAVSGGVEGKNRKGL